MIRRVLPFLIFIFFTTAAAYCEEPGTNIDTNFTGEDWNQLNTIFPVYPSLINIERELVELFKTYLVRGVYAGFAAGADLPRLEGYTYKPADIGNWYYTEADEEEIIDAIDEFYADYRNVRIPIAYALLIISMEFRGDDDAEVGKSLRKMRMEFGVPRLKGRR